MLLLCLNCGCGIAPCHIRRNGACDSSAPVLLHAKMMVWARRALCYHASARNLDAASGAAAAVLECCIGR
jgi:hypothetical protein